MAAMSDHETQPKEPAHDVLAAEEFAMPTADPALEPAHDVLAADEFAMPAADRNVRHSPVVLPGDPTEIEEPHDVLAAEEWAMPAGRPAASTAVTVARRHPGSLWRVALAALAGAL